MYLEIAIVILLTLINGLLATSELAIASAQPARPKLLADKGSKRAGTAIRQFLGCGALAGRTGRGP